VYAVTSAHVDSTVWGDKGVAVYILIEKAGPDRAIPRIKVGNVELELFTNNEGSWFSIIY
jgi:hypothetical protein